MSQNIELRRIMHEVFECDLSKIHDNAAINHLEGWDSLNHINLIMKLIEQGVSIPAANIADLTNFAAIRKYIENQGFEISEEEHESIT